MVDQLWFWIIRRPGHLDTIITSFPDREGAIPSEDDDLQKQILKTDGGDSFRCTGDLVAQILAVCSRALSTKQSVESLQFSLFFENALAHVVSIPRRIHILPLLNYV